MLIPTVDMKEFEKVGFRKCKKPCDKCYYLCVAKGIQMIFLSSAMLDIIKWKEDDPRIHKHPNCRYKDGRTALEIVVEMVKNNMVTCDYLERRLGECQEKRNMKMLK